MEGYWGGTVWTNLGTAFKLFVHYLKLALFPSPLVADYLGDVFPISTGILEPATMAAISVFLAYLLVAWRVYPQSPLLSFAMLWFLILLLPVLHLVPFHELAADHFEYIPMIGPSLAVGIGFSSLLQRFSMRLLLWAGLVGVVLGSSVLVVERNREWKNGETLWEATYRDAPGSYRANANLGEIYFRRGLSAGQAGKAEVEEGLKLTRRSIELDPTRAVSWGNLGAMYYSLGRRHGEAGETQLDREYQIKAVTQFEKAAELEPDNPFTKSNLANAYKELGNIYEDEGDAKRALEMRKQAVELYKRALETEDRRKEVQAIWLGYGGVFIDAGYHDQAIDYLAEYLKAFPDDSRGNYWMGYCLGEERKYQEALPYLEQAVRGKPTIDAWSRLAWSYGKSGQLKKGIDGYTRILSVAPNSSEAHYQIGLLYRKAGNTEKVLDHLNRALALDPDGEHSRHIRSILAENGGSRTGVRITRQEEI
jgi:tetratricopeptide (TPR) repeat protein